jgi:hypothetical protein
MQDVISLETHGLPAVALLSSGFQTQASFEANRQNCPTIQRVFVQHPISNATNHEIEQKANDAFDEIIQSLTTDPILSMQNDKEKQGHVQDDEDECST